MMTTYTVHETGRTWAGQNYSRTTKRWLDGGPELRVEIHADDSGVPLDKLTDEELLAVAENLSDDNELADPGEIADDVAGEFERRLRLICDEIIGWDGESAAWLANRMNDLDCLARRAHETLSYVPGRPYGYNFERDCYDVISLGWHNDREQPMDRNDVYACDRHGTFVVLVAGTTDDGWTTEGGE